MSTKKRESLWGIKIWDKTGIYYYTEVNINTDLQHNVPTESTVGYNAKYPFSTHNGKANYYSGSCSGNFSENTGDCESDYNFDTRTDTNGNIIYNVKYIDGFIQWLHNKQTKYLQLSEQMVVPVNIMGEIQWSTEKSIDDGADCKISFNWEQADDHFSLDNKGMVSYCTSCGHYIAPTANFCQFCGAKVGE